MKTKDRDGFQPQGKAVVLREKQNISNISVFLNLKPKPMTAKEWLDTMKRASDYNPKMTSLIEKYGEMLAAESLSSKIEEVREKFSDEWVASEYPSTFWTGAVDIDNPMSSVQRATVKEIRDKIISSLEGEEKK